MEKIVLIGGVPRSGTNLARKIIGSHSRIAMPPVEFSFFAKTENGKSVEEITTDRDFTKRLGLDVSDLCSVAPDQAYRSLLARYAESVGKPIAGEKSPGNEFYYAAIGQWLSGSEVKFIHLVRNPFDVMASFKHAPFRAQYRHRTMLENMAARCEEWNRSLSLGLARTLFRPRDYCLVKFEELSSDAAQVVERLCAFLDVDFERERMLNLSDFSGHKDNTSFSEAKVAESLDSEGRVRSLPSRKGHLTAEEIQTVGSICGELAQAIDYEDEDFNSASPKLAGSRQGARKSINRIAGLLKLGRG